MYNVSIQIAVLSIIIELTQSSIFLRVAHFRVVHLGSPYGLSIGVVHGLGSVFCPPQQKLTNNCYNTVILGLAFELGLFFKL